MNTHEYQKKLREEGYISETGQPLMCRRCGGRNLLTSGSGQVTYELKCAQCNKLAGRWENGYWDTQST